MIYKCTNPSCGNLGEGDGLPASCPECGSPVKEIREEEMSGRDWSQLGGFWTRRRDNEKRILACYRRAAAMGDVWGICNLGWCMEAGIGTEADPKQAVWLYEQAAETGYVPALCNLGVCYQEGIGVPRDEGRAIELLTDERFADGHNRFMNRGELIDAMDEETFRLYLNYHFATCERGDLVGITSHALDIFQKL